jgi:hypothetical protein
VAENLATYPATCLVEKEMKIFYIININCINFILFYPCTDFNILRKNPTNELKYVNTALSTLLHTPKFQPKRGYPEGLVINFVSRVNNIRVQMSYLQLDPYFVDLLHEIYQYFLRMPPCGLQNVGL